MSATAAGLPGIRELFQRDYTLPYKLLVALLVFHSFRPDRLIPGGSILLYFPTIVLGILMILWFRIPRKVLFNTQTKLFIAFLATITIGMLLARNKSLAFWQFTSLVLYSFIPYLVMVQFIDTPSKVSKYLRLFYILALFFAFLGILNKAIIIVPALADENDFALFMNILIPIGFFLGQDATVLKKKIFYYSSLMILVMAIVSSFSRVALVGLIATGLFLFYKSKNKLTSVLLLALLVITIFSFAPQQYWDKIETIQTQGAEQGTGRERVESWKAGWRMFLDNPIVGVGPRNFGIWFPEYYIQYGTKSPQNMWGRVAHSLYFTLLPETGIIGTLLFAGIVWNNYKNHRYISSLEKKKEILISNSHLNEKTADLIRSEIRSLHYISLGCTGALIAYMSTGAFISVLWYEYFWSLTCFIVMTTNAAQKIETILLQCEAAEELAETVADRHISLAAVRQP